MPHRRRITRRAATQKLSATGWRYFAFAWSYLRLEKIFSQLHNAILLSIEPMGGARRVVELFAQLQFHSPGFITLGLTTSTVPYSRFKSKIFVSVYEKRYEMAQYKYHHFLQQKDFAAYDVLLDPYVQAPDAGIYRCRTCGHEIGKYLCFGSSLGSSRVLSTKPYGLMVRIKRTVRALG